MKGVRSLEILHHRGSTSRVLNLLRTYETSGNTAEYHESPFFENTRLNRAIILKHRLRADERYMLERGKKVATKVIFPLVSDNLSLGGQFFFVGQKNFRTTLSELLGSAEKDLERDVAVLRELDQLPSLDPFLVRESLKRIGVTPAECYFDISPSDLEKMRHFATHEVSKLIKVAFIGEDNKSVKTLTPKLVDLILANEYDDKLEPLRLSLGLSGEEFRDGVYAWRGFLYFKWQFNEIFSTLKRVSSQIDRVKCLQRADFDLEKSIANFRIEFRELLQEATARCRELVLLYDEAFDDLVNRARASAFREFLLDGPQLFVDLGRDMGVISHIASFWTFRFPDESRLLIEPVEFEDMISEFVGVLAPNRSEVSWTKIQG